MRQAKYKTMHPHTMTPEKNLKKIMYTSPKKRAMPTEAAIMFQPLDRS